MTVRSNPRILLLFLIIAAMLGASAAGFLLISAVAGVIILVVALFLSYQFIRFSLSHMRSRVRTDEEGITFHMPGGEEEHFDWEELSLAGYYTQAKGRPFAYVYSEGRDRLINVPREYEHFEELIGELKRRVEFSSFELPPGTTIHEKLRELLGLPSPSADEGEENESSNAEE